MCVSPLSIPPEAKTEGYTADLVIFVGLGNYPYEGFLAEAAPCRIDDNSRPIMGGIQFNKAYMKIDNKTVTIESHIYAALHELTHVLGFSRKLYSLYINPETFETLTNVILTKKVNGIDIAVLNVPPLTERLRAHFNCPTLEGAYLENEGGTGSAYSHLERRIFFNEYMTASALKDARFSEFTLALLEGTGWYKVNYEYAEPMTYGKNKGCEFLDTKCINTETFEPSFKEFCSPLTSKGVYWTRRGFGDCGTKTCKVKEDLWSEFDYWGNKTGVKDWFADNCPQVQVYDGDDCEDESLKVKLNGYETYGRGSKAFIGTLRLLGLEEPKSETEGYCFKTKCIKKAEGYELEVLFGNKGSLKCLTEGDIDTNVGELSGKLNCPDPKDFCEQVLSEGYCRGGCFGNGKCENKECNCSDGWGSYNCAKKEMADKCTRCSSDGLKTTCYGNECVCNPKNTTCMCLLGLKEGKECEDVKKSEEDNENKSSKSLRMVIMILIGILVIVSIFVRKRERERRANQDDGMLTSSLRQGDQDRITQTVL